jgi:hypothetical protein
MSEDDVAAARRYRDERILPRIAESWREEQVSNCNVYAIGLIVHTVYG